MNDYAPASILLEQIKKNSIDSLELSNDPDDYFETTSDFVDAMAQNTSIEKVVFDKDFLACCNGRDRKEIIEACGLLPNVETIALKDSALMIGLCMRNLVVNAKKLKELSMEHCRLMGDDEDFEDFGTALEKSESIKTLRMMDCNVANPKIKLFEVVDSYKASVVVDVV